MQSYTVYICSFILVHLIGSMRVRQRNAATHSTVALSRRDCGATRVTRFVHSKWRGVSLPLLKQHASTTKSSCNEIPRFNEILDYHKIHGTTIYTTPDTKPSPVLGKHPAS
ncbi:uncharacterized protein AKAW2_31398S [Aspergillus luchuensis]|uniref:Uncharacterized protein n=1 Tax=Aspergillus kawachii TaxID=1069201 RepID=A0A7R7W8K5_ASPKA|nr:uncharacterized protein AKAW2_31398S [Aspergillus luchuensis]BCR98079.1 hypothetical protein AKAW2_31398S [Aspergillus luchuensis]